MNFENLNAATGLALSLCALMALMLGWLRWLRPRYRQIKSDAISARDAIVGRDAQYDSITRELTEPALPGIGVRMASQEAQMTEMTKAVTQLAVTHTQLIRVNETLVNHEGRLANLEAATVERVAARNESTAAWGAVEAVANATPPPPPEE